MKHRYNITLTPEMDERLNKHAFLTRKSRSTLIEEALEKYLTGTDDGLRSPPEDEISILKERMKMLEERFQKIEEKNTSSQTSVLPDNRGTRVTVPSALLQTPSICNVTNTPGHDGPTDEVSQPVIALDPEGWYTQSLVSEFLDQSVLPSTRKSIVSLAVARGEMETNGKKRKGCRIKGSSVIRWIASVRKKEKPPVFFLGSQ